MQIGSNRCILNPVSGSADHEDYVTRMMEARGFEVRVTESEDDAVRQGFEAGVDDVSHLAVCGGDGTINDVLRGLAAADHLEGVTLSLLPAGTANILATQVGIGSIDDGIDLVDGGDVRSVDVGIADEQPFVVSCIAGLPANASTAATSELKERFGTLSFLITGVQEAIDFGGLDIRVEAAGAEGEEVWEGEAICILVGNARKFVEEGGQADMEDGLVDVAIVEQMPASNLVTEAIEHRLLGRETEGVTHIQASSLTVGSRDGEPITFSRDGEVAEHDRLSLSVTPGALSLRVGDDYDPTPGEG